MTSREPLKHKYSLFPQNQVLVFEMRIENEMRGNVLLLNLSWKEFLLQVAPASQACLLNERTNPPLLQSSVNKR